MRLSKRPIWEPRRNGKPSSVNRNFYRISFLDIEKGQVLRWRYLLFSIALLNVFFNLFIIEFLRRKRRKFLSMVENYAKLIKK